MGEEKCHRFREVTQDEITPTKEAKPRVVSTWAHDCLNAPETSWFSEELSRPRNPVHNRSLSPCRSVDQDVGELPDPDPVCDGGDNVEERPVS